MEGSVQPILVKPQRAVDTLGPLARLTKGQVASVARLPCLQYVVCLVVRNATRQ